MKKILTVFVILVLSLTSCKDKAPSPGVAIDMTIDISVASSDGEDLLNPDTEGHLAESKIEIYHIINGKKVVVNEPNADYPKGFLVFEDEEKYSIRVFGNHQLGEEFTETIIVWAEGNEDVLRYQVVAKNNGAYQAISKVWFNGTEVWTDDGGRRHIEIVK